MFLLFFLFLITLTSNSNFTFNAPSNAEIIRTEEGDTVTIHVYPLGKNKRIENKNEYINQEALSTINHQTATIHEKEVPLVDQTNTSQSLNNNESYGVTNLLTDIVKLSLFVVIGALVSPADKKK